MEYPLVVTDLKKTYKTKKITVEALKGISFQVKEGEIFGLLGPNGAGKTTAINIIATLLEPTTGSVEVVGYDVSKHKDEVRNSIGIVFQDPAIDGKLTGRENLEFHAMMYGMGKDERRERIEEVLKLVELKDKADMLAENYSGGMKRRLEIARGLMHRPKVLFLDEPTIGLDAQTRRHIWEYIKNLNKESRITIILTTHYMEEADYLCERVAIVDNGSIVAMDTTKNLKDILGGDVVSLEIKSKAAEFLKCVRKEKWIKMAKRHDHHVSLTMERGDKRIPDIVRIAERCGTVIGSVNLRKPSLEDVFLHFTGKTMREEEASRKEKNRNSIPGRRFS